MNPKFTLDNIYKIGTTLAMVAILYLNTKYVTLETFNQHNEFHIKISESLVNISTSLAIMQHQSTLLNDHETRIRVLEKKNNP